MTIVNMGGTLAAHGLSVAAAIKIALTYMVPWGNATFGIAVGQRHRATAEVEGRKTPSFVGEEGQVVEHAEQC